VSKIISPNTVVATILAAMHRPKTKEAAEDLRDRLAAELRENPAVLKDIVNSISDLVLKKAGHTADTLLAYLELIYFKARQAQVKARSEEKKATKRKKQRRK